MNTLTLFLEELSNHIPVGVMDRQTREGLGIEGFSLSLPVETRVQGNGELALSLPRGRLATGFDVPHGHIKVSFVRDGFAQGERY